MADASESTLPDYLLNATELIELLPWWKMWRKLDRKFLLFPGSVSEQPGNITNGLTELDGLFEMIQESLRKQNANK